MNGGEISRGRQVWLRPRWLVLTIAAGVVGCFVNGVWAPFIFDDEESILKNATIRQWWAVERVLRPPGSGTTVAGRPVLNFSFAVNWAISGDRPWSYHLVNIGIHTAAATALWAVARRLLQGGAAGPWATEQAEGLAWAVAVIWAVHPIHTTTVTYIAQRAESLAGLFYLLAIWCGLKAAERQGEDESGHIRGGRGWVLAAAGMGLLGAGCKETVATLPVMMGLIDRLLVGMSWREMWRRRRELYVAVAGATWVLTAWLVVQGGNRGGTAGFLSWAEALKYAAVQPKAVLTYVRTTLWPWPMVFDYGVVQVVDWREVVGYGLVVLLAGLWAVVGIVRGWRSAFIPAAVLVLLAPSSSVVPILTQTMSVHRMYLGSAVVIGGVVLGVGYLLEKLGQRLAGGSMAMGVAGMMAAVMVAVALGMATVARNRLHNDPEALWRDTVAKVPGNARAHNNLGVCLAGRGQYVQAIRHYEQALALDANQPNTPGNLASAYFNLGNALRRTGRADAAVAMYARALDIRPDWPDAMVNLGVTLQERGRLREAAALFKRALEFDPQRADAAYNLGNVLWQMGQEEEAEAAYRRALELEPEMADAANNLGNLLAQRDRLAEAEHFYRRAIASQEHHAEAWRNLGLLEARRGRMEEALTYFERSAELRPENARIWLDIGRVCMELGRLEEAHGALEMAQRLAREQGLEELARRAEGYLEEVGALKN